MADVVVLPGIERRDLVGEPVPAQTVLEQAIAKGVSDVVVVGRHRNGSLYVAGSLNDIDKSIGVLMSGVHFLTSGEFGQGIREHHDEEPQE